MSTNLNAFFYRVMYENFAGNTGQSMYMSHGNAKIEIYSGTRPASVTDSATSLGAVRLSNIYFSSSSFTSSVNGVSRLANKITDMPDASGVASWARVHCFYASSGTQAFFDTDVSLSGDGGGVILSTLNLNPSQSYTIDALAIFCPETHGSVTLSLALRNAIINSIVIGDKTTLAIGQDSTLSVYTGAQPASVYVPPTGTKLADFVSPSTSTEMWSYPDSSGTALRSTENNWYTTTVDADGVPGYFRIVKGSLILQGTCGTTGADVNVDKSSVVSGDDLTITEMSLLAA